MASASTGAISKKRKFVADGVFYAELNEFFQRELAEEGYSGVEVRVTPTVTDISESCQVFSNPLCLTNYSQSSELPIHRRFLANKDDASENSPLSFKNASNFRRTLSHSTLPRSKTVVSLLSLNASLSVTSSLMDWLCGEPATVSCGSSWRVEPRVVRLLYLGNFVLQERRA